MKTATFILGWVNFLFSGYVFMTIWAWFVVTAFGVVEIGYAQSLGFLILLTFFKNKHRDNPELTDQQNLEFAIALIFTNVLMLGLGAIVHAFI